MAEYKTDYKSNPDELQICSIQFSQSSHIRLNGFPSFPLELVSPLRSAIIEGWHGGITREKDLHGAVDFELGGFPMKIFPLHGNLPWSGRGSVGVNARR